jgi:hypothetical protein
MRITNATALSDFARKSVKSVSDFTRLVHNLIMDVRDSYRYKLQKLRGPGPEWRATQPWQVSALAKVDSEAVSLTEHQRLSPVYVRRRDAAHRTR